MDKKYLINLLHKYNNGEASDADRQFIHAYYNLYEHEPDVLVLLNEEEKQRLKTEIQTAVWENISRQEEVKIIRLSPVDRSKRWLQVAAAMIIMVFTTAIIYYYHSQNKQVVVIQPVQQNRKIREIAGENKFIQLPDGSVVTLSKGSKFIYPASFAHTAIREVYLEGEGYFDIQHDASKPFIVHTGKVNTTVLGTAFNIKAVAADKTITVTVTRGKVKVGDDKTIYGILVPNQQIVYNKEANSVTQAYLNAKPFIAWKEQDLLMDNVSVAQAARMLQDRYGTTIICNDEAVRNRQFTTTVSKGEALLHVLQSICEFNGAQYQLDKETNTIVINSK